MLIYKLISKDKEQTLRFPENADELTLKQACLYEDAFNEASENFKKITELADLSLNELGMYSIEAAKILNKVFNVDIPSASKISTNEEAKDLITTIIFLYAKLTKLLDYKPKERPFFIYKTEKWFVPTSVINVFTRQLENPNLTFNEVMLLLQIEHIYKEQKDGIGLYHMLLNMIAVSARRNLADALPLTDAALKDYQMRQMKYFEDISYSVALDFRFFFLKFKERLAADKYLCYLFSNKKYYNEIEDKKSQADARIENRAKTYYERNGWWIVFNRVAEVGVFNKTGYTPFEAVRMETAYTVLKWYIQDKYKPF